VRVSAAPTLKPPPAFIRWFGLGIPGPIKPVTIASSYLYQIPVLKPAGSLIVSILVADLVFLQALWMVFTRTVGFGTTRQHPDSQYCVGCATRVSKNGDYELVGGAKSKPLLDKGDGIATRVTGSDVDDDAASTNREVLSVNGVQKTPLRLLTAPV
jgi:hypothetical protein